MLFTLWPSSRTDTLNEKNSSIPNEPMKLPHKSVPRGDGKNTLFNSGYGSTWVSTSRRGWELIHQIISICSVTINIIIIRGTQLFAEKASSCKFTISGYHNEAKVERYSRV